MALTSGLHCISIPHAKSLVAAGIAHFYKIEDLGTVKRFIIIAEIA